MPDLYEPCPCGSGKKFKWCCQPIYVGINHAWEQEAGGQHEAAQRILDQVVAENGGNPEAWGQKARLLFAHGKTEEAEAALQKAFDINPNYPFGLLLRASFRFQEGEIPGALLLARRAVAAYAPEARPYLAEAYFIISECEMRLNRPVAARAALRLVTYLTPGDPDLQKSFDGLFGPEGRLPECARREYAFRSPAPGADRDRRAAWDRALAGARSPRLGELPPLFEGLTQSDPTDSAAWFNLGLSRAWLGENPTALEALDRCLDLEQDDSAATTAAALAEVLRCGQGMEEQCDYREHAFALPVRNPEPISQLLREWFEAGRLVSLPNQPEGVFMALVLELTTVSLITVGSPAADVGRLAGYLVLVGNMMQVTSPLKEPFERLRDEMRQKLALGLGELQERQAPIQFHDVVAEALIFPLKKGDSEDRVLTHAQTYYEEKWIHQPRRSLMGTPPVDAAASPRLRRRLLGVIQFIQDCSKFSMLGGYDFDRLRRKLGLLTGPAPAAAPATQGAAPTPAAVDISAMGAAELGRLDTGTLSDAQLEQAYQAALKLDAQELATHFARTLVARPPSAEQPDRFPWYTYLMQRALREGDTGAALDYVNEGEKADCEQNEGRRRNDYELRRGQVLAKRGETDAAEDVFRRLIERVPGNFRFRGSAAEAMLSARQGAKALRFAEEGLAAARQANDRDSEQYLAELAEAARRQS
jgi:tetratricopeptide (TPR) repeat protein